MSSLARWSALGLSFYVLGCATAGDTGEHPSGSVAEPVVPSGSDSRGPTPPTLSEPARPQTGASGAGEAREPFATETTATAADSTEEPEPTPNEPGAQPEPADDEPASDGSGSAGAPAIEAPSEDSDAAGAGGASAEAPFETADAGSSGSAGTTGSPLPEPDVAAPPPLDDFRLAVVGSSTAAGEGASDDDAGWVSLLEASLAESVTGELEVWNLAQGGTTSNELLPGSGSRASIDEAIDAEPNLILVALAGSNDLSSGTSEAEFIERLAEMRDAGESAGIPVFFVSTAPKDLGESERETLRDWAVTMRQTFEPCWVPIDDEPFTPCYIDVFDALASETLRIDLELGSGDGIHLNDAGHRVIFEIARGIVLPYVCAATRCE